MTRTILNVFRNLCGRNFTLLNGKRCFCWWWMPKAMTLLVPHWCCAISELYLCWIHLKYRISLQHTLCGNSFDITFLIYIILMYLLFASCVTDLLNSLAQRDVLFFPWHNFHVSQRYKKLLYASVLKLYIRVCHIWLLKMKYTFLKYVKEYG
jgi:hypothetical protein